MKYTPPPLFQLLPEKECERLKFTPVSSGASAGPPGCYPGYEFHYSPSQNCVYTPSTTGIRQNLVFKRKVLNEQRDFKLTWWEPESIFLYDAMLVSAYYGMHWTHFRGYFNIPRKNFLLFADSGGYEQLRHQVRISAVDVLRWEEENADIAVVLDVPPKDPDTGNPTHDPEHFTACAKQTRRNAEYMLKNRVKQPEDGFMFYMVLQGGFLSQLKEWYETQPPMDQFDGICSSPQPAKDPMQAALHACFVHDKGVKRIHMLLGTGRDVTPVYVYAAKMFDLFTFDSSSYAQGSKTRAYFLHDGTKISFAYKDCVKINYLPCDCPVCQLVTPKILADTGSVPGALISLHNLYVYVRQIQTLQCLADDTEFYKTYVKRKFDERTALAIQFIDEYLETNDLERVYKKYREYYEGQVSDRLEKDEVDISKILEEMM